MTPEFSSDAMGVRGGDEKVAGLPRAQGQATVLKSKQAQGKHQVVHGCTPGKGVGWTQLSRKGYSVDRKGR
ncbi:protein of unknown function [Methylocaldum szegediense]|uniref:Uncharacterized protein n=1 Tax=Methylocaldum szegediense TaxID=73780 RepID=A0ABM9I202_9GAMM|nr:protein of unknown function [Methylocaldum szegediense]